VRRSDERRPKRRQALARVEQVEISSIAGGGEGVGRLTDGRAIFVHRSAPGELVEVKVFYERPRWARGRLLRVLQPSPDRRVAPCPHYAECGGCTLEHLQYDAQLRVKGRIVADALARIGGIATETPEVVPSPRQHRYRNRVSFALRRGGSGEVHAGFHSLQNPDRIVPIDGRCLLPEEPIAAVWDRLRASWGPDARLLPAGETLRLTLRATAAGRVSLLIEGGYSSGRPVELLAAVPALDSIWHQRENSTTVHVAGAPGIPETWGAESFTMGGTAFLQVNRSAAAHLEEHVVDRAGDVSGMHVVDAYCGIGIHARRLARAGARVTGIELDVEALGIASAADVPGATFHLARVEDALSAVLPADLLILNPPRAGISVDVGDAILATPPPRIIYVSCDPATLARDLKRLANQYATASVRCFDLFPQTAHVESVVELIRH
jgi:23S rRNA (uracil1939-C5)-methyltransferase